MYDITYLEFWTYVLGCIIITNMHNPVVLQPGTRYQGNAEDYAESQRSLGFPTFVNRSPRLRLSDFPVRPQASVRTFHRIFDLLINTSPTLADLNTQLLLVRLIAEEFDELKEALADEDIVKVADALGDLTYVVYGAAVSFGIDLDDVFEEIHRSNMTKIGGHKDEHGKWVKPADYIPADIVGVLRRQGWDTSKGASE